MSTVSLYGLIGGIVAGIGICLIVAGIFARRSNPEPVGLTPMIAAALEHWVPSGESPADRYRSALISLNTIAERNIAKALHEHSELGLSVFYPDEIEHSPTP